MSNKGKWITLQQAAAALGVGETSIRRRIASGKLESKKDAGRVYIRLDTEAQEPEEESDLRQLVQVLQEQNAALNQRLEEASRQNDQAQQLAAMQQQTIQDLNQRLLEAPVPWWKFWA
tara:strand:- start:32 stop:385 length:354 start_codon:yes stop_codon:yes gene_type:complete